MILYVCIIHVFTAAIKNKYFFFIDNSFIFFINYIYMKYHID